jgi:hypothetical protein
MSKNNFNINNYTIPDLKNPNKLFVEGYKLPPPSKRITLRLTGLKIISAKIIYKHKKGDIECEVIRINHLKSFGEIRLHTNSVLYPGNYEVTLEYSGNLDEEQLKANQVQ